MELCSLEDAFPTIKTDSLRGTPPGCKDTTASKEERKAARKRAKKCKGPPLSYLEAEETDPDRPAVKRMDAVPTVTEQNEEFAMPVLPKASCTFSDPGYPSYFGKGVDDTEEGFSSFTNVIGDDPNYRLESDATKSFELKGVAMPGGSPTLPVPSVNDVWKPATPTGSYTAFVSSLPLPGGMIPKGRDDIVYRQEQQDNDELPGPTAAEDSETVTRDVLIKRIEELQGRLDQLETTRRKNSQTEILIFVGTGIFVLASLHMITGRRR
jgi:hypothetical protein